MSDTSQGPGWWLASDGKWYPPELHPDPSGEGGQLQGAESPQGAGWWLASDGRWYPPELHPGAETLVNPEGAEVSQGPGWWLASDGRWYPPELHPDVLARAAAEPPETAVAATGAVATTEPHETVTAQPEPEPAPESEPEPVVAAEPQPEAEPVATSGAEPEPEPVVSTEPEPEPEHVVAFEPEPEPLVTQPAVAETPQAPAEPQPVAEAPSWLTPSQPESGPPTAPVVISTTPHDEPWTPPEMPKAGGFFGRRETDEPKPPKEPKPPREPKPPKPPKEPKPPREPKPPKPPKPPKEPKPPREPKPPKPPREPKPPKPPREPKPPKPPREPKPPKPPREPGAGPRVSRRTVEVAGSLVVVAAVIVAVVLATSGGKNKTASSTTTAPPSGAPQGWTLSNVHVVGGPVLAGGRVVVIDQAPDGSLQLAAIEPSTGSIAWELPYSASDISPQTTLVPLVSGTTALDLVPVAGATNPSVTVAGIDVTTGKQVWADSTQVTVTDAPELCTQESVFCISTQQPSGSALVAISPSTGSALGTVQGPYRQMATDLYQTTANPPALEQIAGNGQPQWTNPVSTLFGGSQYTPNYGWNFTTSGGLDVGTVGITPNGNSEPLDQLKTVGIDTTSGAVKWSTPGAFQCFAVLQLSDPFVCRYGGPASWVNGTLSTTGVSLTLQGLNPATGQVTWSHALADAQALTTGDGVPIADAHRIVVSLATGGSQLLDLSTGATSQVPSGEVMWCGKPQQVAVTAAPGALANGQRVGATFFEPCTAAGKATSAKPTHAVPGLGVSVGGLFVYASSGGLTAVPLS